MVGSLAEAGFERRSDMIAWNALRSEPQAGSITDFRNEVDSTGNILYYIICFTKSSYNHWPVNIAESWSK